MILREIAPQDVTIIQSWPAYPEEFKDLGLERIYLIVRKSNHRARKLYWHCDFRFTGECRKEVNGIVVDFREMELDRVNFEGTDEA
jgi:RimJ/RimL family protein N-acetyltransferase